MSINSEAVARYQKSEKGVQTRRARERRPEVRARKQAYDNSPERKAARLAYQQTPERKEAERLRNQNESRRAAVRAYNASPEGRAARAAHDKTPDRLADCAAKEAKRRALKLAYACSCCTQEQFKELYRTAYFLGLQVDHRKPLVLGGPHCRSNLQLLTVAEHKIKTREDMRLVREWRRSLVP